MLTTNKEIFMSFERPVSIFLFLALVFCVAASAKQYGKDQTYNQVRNGARLNLVYVADSNSFIGSVENTTAKTLTKVRVEVHLSNGTELGPTKPTDLAPGQKMRVELKATKREFDTWSAHPESGNDEHGKDGNHNEENDDDS